LTLVVHCLSRTPSTKKSQLASNYSALTLKFSAPDPTRASSRNRFVIPSQPTSEGSEVNNVVKLEEGRHFSIEGSPFMIDHPYHAVVKLTPPFEPVNFSYSQQTTTTTATLSRDNSMKCTKAKKVRLNLNETLNATRTHGKQRKSFAEKLKKVLTFKTDGNVQAFGEGVSIKGKLRKKISNGSLKSVMSNSSLKEIDEEASSEVAQMMSEIRKGGRVKSAEIS
jgi:hypothetical protein